MNGSIEYSICLNLMLLVDSSSLRGWLKSLDVACMALKIL